MSKDLPPSRTAAQFIVRFPEGMREQIAEEAEKNNRSMNAEIVARLKASLTPPAVPRVIAQLKTEPLTVPFESHWPWPVEALSRVEERLKRIEKAVMGSAHVEVQPMTASGGDESVSEPADDLPVTSAQPYKPGRSLPRPPLTRYRKPRK